MVEGSAGTAPIEVTDFDVLATEFPNQEYVLWEEYNQKKHIGNNRLNVLIDIHAESFGMNNISNNQDECDKIIGMIQDATFGKKDSCTPDDCGDCNKYRGRFLVKGVAGLSDQNTSHNNNTDWRELDENLCRRLIVQTLMTRIEERKKDLFEPLDMLSDLNSGRQGSRNSNSFGNRAPRLRRSRSATNLSEDTKNALYELFNGDELIDEDPFEPLPMTANSNFHEIEPDYFGGRLNLELNNRKKRERRRSLLRRSNSFESLFDRKKTFKNHRGAFPSSKRQPSFIQSFSGLTPDCVSSTANGTTNAHLETTLSGFHDVETSEAVVSTYEGLDVVLQSDRKTLNPSKTILGNNRLRILLQLESDRFNLLSHSEKQKTAANLQRTITEKWKGRMLTEDGNGMSYCVLSCSESTDAIYSLLLDGNKHREGRKSHQVFAASTRPSNYVSSTSPPKPNSLLAAAPPLPDYLRDASKEILKSGKDKYSNDMTPQERQAAAIEALKERNKVRQLVKQKAKSED